MKVCENAPVTTERDKHERPSVRKVADVETLKALGDPLRLAILRVLMGDDGGRPRVMSVKELAGRRGEQPTRLYRHIKQLEARDLIETAETRLVAGIVEHRYRAAQSSVVLDADFFGRHRGTEDAAATITATFDDYRDEYLDDARAGRVTSAHVEPITISVRESIPAAKAAEFRDRLAALVQDLHDAGHHDDGVEVRLFAAYYASDGR